MKPITLTQRISLFLKKNSFRLFTALLILTASGCKTVKYLPPGEDLYVGSSIRLESKEEIKNKNQLKTELSKLARPKPNERILWARPKLWFYNIATASPHSKIKQWIKKKWGEAPVLLSDAHPGENANLMASRLNSLGYFDSQVKYKIESSKRKATITYTAIVNRPYNISKIKFPELTDSLSIKIKATEEKSLF